MPSTSNNLSAAAQLKSLAKLTEMTGGLHQAQIDQLKLYGLACSQAVVNAAVDVDVEGKVIRYTMMVAPSLLEKDISSRLDFLKIAVKAILGSLWTTKVRFRQQGTISETEDVKHQAD